jgi:hypothetical protein
VCDPYKIQVIAERLPDGHYRGTAHCVRGCLEDLVRRAEGKSAAEARMAAFDALNERLRIEEETVKGGTRK